MSDEPIVLYGRRRAMEDVQRREAAGEDLWTASFSSNFRNRLWMVYSAFENRARPTNGAVYNVVKTMILYDQGTQTLSTWETENATLLGFVSECHDDEMPTVIEAMCMAFRQPEMWLDPAEFEDEVASQLDECRIAYALVDGRMIPRQSQELNAEVVVPAVTLLSGRKGLQEVEDAYQDALKELAQGQPGDAITDAGRALQKLLEAKGCSGDVLGDLIKSARRLGLLGGHDPVLTDAISKILTWVAADRNNYSDAHNSPALSREDAWLTVHVVGALIVRLSDDKPRP